MRSWLISLGLHVAVLAVAAALVSPAPPRGEPAPPLVEVDLIDVVDREPPPIQPTETDDGPAGEAGTPARRGPAPRAKVDRAGPPPVAVEPDPLPAPPASVTEALGLQIGGEGLGGMSEDGLGLGGFGNGPGRGGGGGVGTGRGGGDGDGRGVAAAPPKPPSKARPARLIYPKRFRKEREGEVFVVILKVDENGAVDGVKLEQGVNPHQDQKALDAVWRFRYDPARDRDGRPIASKVVQRFMVNQ